MVAALAIVPMGRRDIAPSRKDLAVLEAPLADIAEHMQVAGRCRETQLGMSPLAITAKNLETARRRHAAMLPDLAQADRALLELHAISIPPFRMPLRYPHAISMLSALFATFGKRGDDSKTMIAACADMFSPASDIVGRTLGLWTPPPKHPLVLAIAVKHLIATAKFVGPSELLAAMQQASHKIGLLAHATGQWLDRLDEADKILFAFDREQWERAHAHGGAAVRAMAALAEHDDDDEQRCALLNRLYDASQRSLAACKTPASKRTRKPRK